MRLKSVILFITLISTGCAYFNIYYNAKSYYNLALKEKEKNPNSNTYKIKADSTIQKTAKLIQYYPKSKLVDDALLLMAKAYILKNENEKAQKKLSEIETYYGNSNIIDEVYYLYALLLYNRKEFTLSLLKLEHIREKKNLMDDIIVLRAKCLISLDSMEKAIGLLETSLNKGTPINKKIDLYTFLGDLYLEKTNYIKADEYYHKILKLNPEKDIQYIMLVKISSIKTDEGKYDEALNSLMKLKEMSPTQDIYNTINLEVARIHTKLRENNKATDIYTDIIKTTSIDSIKLKAIHYKSLIEEKEENLNEALQTLKDISRINTKDSLYFLCERRLNSLMELNKYIEMDSLKSDSLSIDSLVKINLRIAEIYEFNLNQSMKAKNILLKLYNKYPNCNEFSHILYNLGWIYENIYVNKDSANYYYNKLIIGFPNCKYSKYLKEDGNNETDKISNIEQ